MHETRFRKKNLKKNQNVKQIIEIFSEFKASKTVRSIEIRINNIISH